MRRNKPIVPEHPWGWLCKLLPHQWRTKGLRIRMRVCYRCGKGEYL